MSDAWRREDDEDEGREVDDCSASRRERSSESFCLRAAENSSSDMVKSRNGSFFKTESLKRTEAGMRESDERKRWRRDLCWRTRLC